MRYAGRFPIDRNKPEIILDYSYEILKAGLLVEKNFQKPLKDIKLTEK